MVLQVTGSQSRIDNLLFHPRLSNSILLAIGGTSINDPSDFIKAYDSWTNSWIRVPLYNPVPVLSYHGTAFLGRSVYIVGGFLNSVWEFSNSVYRFNPETHNW